MFSCRFQLVLLLLFCGLFLALMGCTHSFVASKVTSPECIEMRIQRIQFPTALENSLGIATCEFELLNRSSQTALVSQGALLGSALDMQFTDQFSRFWALPIHAQRRGQFFPDSKTYTLSSGGRVVGAMEWLVDRTDLKPTPLSLFKEPITNAVPCYYVLNLARITDTDPDDAHVTQIIYSFCVLVPRKENLGPLMLVPDRVGRKEWGNGVKH